MDSEGGTLWARSRLERLADKGDRDDESIVINPLDEYILERQVLVLDRTVPRENDGAQPRADVVEDSTLRAELLSPLLVEERGRVYEGLVKHEPEERLDVQGIEEPKVHLMVVRLDADPLVNEVVCEPSRETLPEVALHLR